MKKLLIGFALAALMLAGCKGNSPAGKWTAVIAGSKSDETMSVEFSAPDKMTATVDAPGGPGRLVVAGTYKLDGDTLTATASDAKLDYSGPQADHVQNAFEVTKSIFMDNVRKELSGKIKWDGNDKFTVASAESKLTTVFTRAK
jgi:hypothetical protein